jgi:hypothetical protein
VIGTGRASGGFKFIAAARILIIACFAYSVVHSVTFTGNILTCPTRRAGLANGIGSVRACHINNHTSGTERACLAHCLRITRALRNKIFIVVAGLANNTGRQLIKIRTGISGSVDSKAANVDG